MYRHWPRLPPPPSSTRPLHVLHSFYFYYFQSHPTFHLTFTTYTHVDTHVRAYIRTISGRRIFVYMFAANSLVFLEIDVEYRPNRRQFFSTSLSP